MFYPTITTIDDLGQKNINGTKQKITEATKLKIRTACFFPTCLNKNQRQLAYKLLKQSSIKNIPLVHLRSDMTSSEIKYLQKNFNVKTFNLHGSGKYLPNKNLGKNLKLIYLENLFELIDKKIFKNHPRICLDVTHLEATRRERKFQKVYQQTIRLLKTWPCACGHASAIWPQRHTDPYDDIPRYDHHVFKNLSEFNYLTRYKKYLPKIVALEVENSLADQLRAIKYINKKLTANH